MLFHLVKEILGDPDHQIVDVTLITAELGGPVDEHLPQGLMADEVLPDSLDDVFEGESL